LFFVFYHDFGAKIANFSLPMPIKINDHTKQTEKYGTDKAVDESAEMRQTSRFPRVDAGSGRFSCSRNVTFHVPVYQNVSSLSLL
jgi:hypothetical protein